MILSRLVAFPESRRILKIHMLAVPFLALQWAIVAMVPVLLRDHFRASPWETTVSTSAIAVMSLLSIFWNEVYRRLSVGWYLLLLWVTAVLPLAGVALCGRPETVLVFVVLSAAGFGAMTPLTGDILRSCYAPAIRGRVFSVVQVIGQSTVMGTTYGIGVWLKADAEAFRTYLPVGALLIAVGMGLIRRIARQPLFQERHLARPTERLGTSLRNASRNMLAVFTADRSFRRYETAFFIYGLGWMACHALLPFLVVDRLMLNYRQVAWSTQTAFQFAQLVMILPTGHLLDRHGPMRISGRAFLILTLYPLGLMLADGATSLMLVTVIYGIGMTGVNLTWTVGPVALAREASQAPYYLAIHATMVGFRASIGQFSAVALYQLTGIHVPLVLAAAMFATGGILMLRLARDHRRVEQAPPPRAEIAPAPAEAI